MFFAIDKDSGDSIVGWLVLDNPSKSGRVLVRSGGRSRIVVADSLRSDVRELGIHTTGEVGFFVDESVFPGVADAKELELYDAESMLQIYGRVRPQSHIEKKLFLFDTGYMPQPRMDASIARHFAIRYLNANRISLETMLVLINNKPASSLFLSGRLNMVRYAQALEENEFVTAALLRDPFENLAERLLLLGLVQRSGGDAKPLDGRLAGSECLLPFVKDLAFGDSKAVLAAFRRTTPEQREAMRDPIVRALACNVDEAPTRNHVSIALDHLARMNVVGLWDRFDSFRALLAAALGADALGTEQPDRPAPFTLFAQSLADIGLAGDLLQHDLAFYSFAKKAVVDVLDGREDHGGRDTQTI